jgi:hypothetical protein
MKKVYTPYPRRVAAAIARRGLSHGFVIACGLSSQAYQSRIAIVSAGYRKIVVA